MYILCGGISIFYKLEIWKFLDRNSLNSWISVLPKTYNWIILFQFYICLLRLKVSSLVLKRKKVSSLTISTPVYIDSYLSM